MRKLMKNEIKYYQSRAARITGTNYTEVRRRAQAIFRDIDAQTGNRNTYVRSVYFHKQKVFLKTFWNHTYDKFIGERKKRMPLYAAAIDLIKNTRTEPEVRYEIGEKFYRFYGITMDGIKFVVQIKENKKGEKYHMSVFPKG
jgi:hypothetical protein